jgi:hypothetical protein
MRIINRKFHALLDYIWSLALIGAPYVFNVSDNPAVSWTLIIAGVVVLTQALLTNYEGGILALIPMRVHLLIDILTGVALAVSPWLFNFASDGFLVQLISGLFAVVAALMTNPEPAEELPSTE